MDLIFWSMVGLMLIWGLGEVIKIIGFTRENNRIVEGSKKIKIVLSDESWERWDAESRRLQKMVGNAR